VFGLWKTSRHAGTGARLFWPYLPLGASILGAYGRVCGGSIFGNAG
jgi:hypothetical protein